MSRLFISTSLRSNLTLVGLQQALLVSIDVVDDESGEAHSTCQEVALVAPTLRASDVFSAQLEGTCLPLGVVVDEFLHVCLGVPQASKWTNSFSLYLSTILDVRIPLSLMTPKMTFSPDDTPKHSRRVSQFNTQTTTV